MQATPECFGIALKPHREPFRQERPVPLSQPAQQQRQLSGWCRYGMEKRMIPVQKLPAVAVAGEGAQQPHPHQLNGQPVVVHAWPPAAVQTMRTASISSKMSMSL
jgi:hypothetical protein